MLIDWFTVGAQVVNFVILVWLLKRFLYRPVLDAIDAREARIAHQIADAEATRVAALSEQQDFKRRSDELDAQRAALLKQATDDAQAERERLLKAARQDADASAVRRQAAERQDTTRLRRSIADRTRDEVFAIARRVVGDLADATLDERIAAAFLRRLAALEPASLAALASGLNDAQPQARVRSAFSPAAVQREALHAAIIAALESCRADTAISPIDVVFEAAPELCCGIELVVGGRKLGWNISQYMDSLEQMSTAAEPPAAPAAGPGTHDPLTAQLGMPE